MVQIRHYKESGPNRKGSCADGNCYYSNYLHLSGVIREHTDLSNSGDVRIKKGEVIGYSGESGIGHTGVCQPDTADGVEGGFDHLHFEFRDGGIKQMHAIHPLRVLPYPETTAATGLTVNSVDTADPSDYQVDLTVLLPPGELDLNRVEVAIYDGSNGSLLGEHAFDMNQWTYDFTAGEDGPTDTRILDTAPKYDGLYDGDCSLDTCPDRVHVRPSAFTFNPPTDTYQIDFTFFGLEGPVAGGPARVEVRAIDVLGNNNAVTYLTGSANDAPVANAQSVVTAEDTDKAITLTASDPDGDSLTYSVVTSPANGNLTGSAPNLNYAPDPDFNGPDNFSFKVNDGTVDSPHATVSIAVTPVNDPPVSAFTYVCSYLVCTFDGADSTDLEGSITNYAWAFGDGSVGSGTTPTHSYAGAGTYTVTLTVTDNEGAVAEASQQVTVTDLVQRPPILYFSLSDDGNVGGLSVSNHDIVAFDGTNFSLYFDGSDVGLGDSFRLDAFSIDQSLGEILMSSSRSGTLPGISGEVDDSDIVKFTGASLGDTTSGTFSLYFDASDVGLTEFGEDVDALELLPDGRLLVSTSRSFEVPGVSGKDEDIIVFTPTSLGSNTSGTWELYFDGGDVGLGKGSEDVDGLAVDGSGKIHLSTRGKFAVPGVRGRGEDVFEFDPTNGTFNAALPLDGSLYGLSGNNVWAIDLP